MKVRMISFVAALGLLTPPPIRPEEQEVHASKAGHLLKTCKALVALKDKTEGSQNTNDDFNSGFCLGFIVSQRADAAYLTLIPKGRPICFPDQVTYDQLVRVVVTHLEAHPEALEDWASSQTFRAWRHAWPCKEPTAKSK